MEVPRRRYEIIEPYFLPHIVYSKRVRRMFVRVDRGGKHLVGMRYEARLDGVVKTSGVYRRLEIEHTAVVG